MKTKLKLNQNNNWSIDEFSYKNGQKIVFVLRFSHGKMEMDKALKEWEKNAEKTTFIRRNCS